MRRRLSGLVHTCLLLGCLHLQARSSVLDESERLELKGKFRESAAVLAKAIAAEPQGSAAHKRLEFELDRLDRIRRDFSLTEESLQAALRSSVSNLSVTEFEQWLKEDRFDCREIDGKRRYMGSSVANLFFRYPELSPRRMPRRSEVQVERGRMANCMEIEEAALQQNKPYVLPKRFRATMTIRVVSNAAPAGEIISAWLPIPRLYPFQTDVEVVSSVPPIKSLAGPESPIRSAYLEQASTADAPTDFKLTYEYTAHGVRFHVDPDRVKSATPNNAALRPFLAESPHVVFTPEMRALAQQIGGSETNLYLKAKRFYDWISENIKYSFAIEYSTIRNISDYCRSRGYGDCGQEALLFITLCRMNGIPARWQSGWNTFPTVKNIHDWAEIYLEPYGWMPVDPYMGIYAMRYTTDLTPKEKRFLRDFYFGGLDQYRMIANSDHNQTLDPPKKSMRSDDVDFQRGELEAGNRNLYFNKFSYGLTIRELHPAL